MRIFLLAALGLLLAACDQTTQSSGSPSTTTSTATANADLPPIYEPLIDMHRVHAEKYRKDLAECRQQAAPQEAAARQARQQQAAGTGLSVAGAVASFIPVSTYGQARNLANATDAAQNVGGSVAAGGAAAADAATADYALVVNTCLAHKKYRLLRG
jgi:predicted component of type VI protein secretion system